MYMKFQTIYGITLDIKLFIRDWIEMLITSAYCQQLLAAVII